MTSGTYKWRCTIRKERIIWGRRHLMWHICLRNIGYDRKEGITYCCLSLLASNFFLCSLVVRLLLHLPACSQTWPSSCALHLLRRCPKACCQTLRLCLNLSSCLSLNDALSASACLVACRICQPFLQIVWLWLTAVSRESWWLCPVCQDETNARRSQTRVAASRLISLGDSC